MAEELAELRAAIRRELELARDGDGYEADGVAAEIVRFHAAPLLGAARKEAERLTKFRRMVHLLLGYNPDVTADAEVLRSLEKLALAWQRGHTAPWAEVEWLRREVEFEANGERWSNAIVGREGHEYVNGGNACACGTRCPSLGDWERHLAASRLAEGRPLCACTIDYSALDHTRWTPPQCAVHPACPAHGGHPHRGMKCLDCPSCVSSSVLPDGEAQ